MILNVKNETSTLKCVVLGQPNIGKKPTLEDTYDAKSYESVKENKYPHKEDVEYEMQAFENVLKKHGVEVLRPCESKEYNQIFSRDIAFVIDDKIVISNMIGDRSAEQYDYNQIFDLIDEDKKIKMPDDACIEGGDVILWNDHIFIGGCSQKDIDKFKGIKTARTNDIAVEFLKTKFRDKKIHCFELVKNDTDPYEGILHLDCTFMPVGKDKVIIYKDGFANEKDYLTIVDIFGKENIFEITREEVYYMNTNIFSISPNIVVSEQNFTRLNKYMEEKWGMIVEIVPYEKISRMGGLLRCSTMPLIRDND